MAFTHKDCEIVKREVPYKGIFTMVRYQLRHQRFNGGWSNVLIREIVERRAAAAILLYDPNLDKVILIQQFRPGAIKDQQSPWVIEIVAGVIEPNETPDKLVVREAKEEADCEVLDLYPICEYFVSPGTSNEYMWIFCGRIDASKAGGIHGLIDEEEDIKVLVLSLDEASQLAQQGQIKTAPAMLSLQWLQLNSERLKKLWQVK
jgi:ADP-ribose pyrophosphatase